MMPGNQCGKMSSSLMDGAVRKKFLRLHLIRGFHIDEVEVRGE